MKNSLILSFVLLCGHSYACTDLSGTYEREDLGEMVTLIVEQEECKKADFTYKDSYGASQEFFIFDGVKRETGEFDGITIFESSILKDGAIVIDGENHFSRDNTNQKYNRKINITTDGSLVDALGSYGTDGTFTPTSQFIYSKSH